MTVYIPENAALAAEVRYLAALNGLAIVSDPAEATFSLVCNEPAHRLCADKQAAHDFLAAGGFPQPADFPSGSEPYIVKPATGGGCGRGIWATEDYCEAGGGVNAGFLVQEELHGDVLSVAVAGCHGRIAVCPAVRLIMDDRYDRCAAELPAAADAALRPLAERLGQALALEGVLEFKAVVTAAGAHIISLNEGLPALASTALHHGAGLDPLGALAALAEGRTPQFSASPCRIRLEAGGKHISLRDAGRLASFTAALVIE